MGTTWGVVGVVVVVVILNSYRVRCCYDGCGGSRGSGGTGSSSSRDLVALFLQFVTMMYEY